MNRDLAIAETKQKMLNTFKYYTQGPSVPSDGNCGLHAICEALVDGSRLTGSSVDQNTIMLKIYKMFELQGLPNYWWSDEELAVIANNFGYDMYIYNETNGTGIVYGKSIRPPLVLYNVNDNSHWIPGIKTVVPSLYIPENFTIIENISEVLSVKQIQNKIKEHLLMRSLNPSRGWVETYSVRYDRSRSSSNGRRVTGINSKPNRSGSVGRDGWQDGSHSGRNKIRRNKIRDESRSGGRNGRRSSRKRDEVRILKQEASGPKLEKSHDNGVNDSHGAEEKESHSGGEIGSYSEREKSNSRKSNEKLKVQYSPPVNNDHNYGMKEIKQKLSLFAKLKNTVLSKITKQLYHWRRNKKNEYKKFDLFDSEDKVDHSENTVLNTIYNDRYTIIRDMSHQFISKNERQLLASEACDTLMALQSLEPTVFQLKPIESPQLETVEAEYPMADVNYYQTAAIDCVPNVIVVCCLNNVIDCCPNNIFQYLYKTYECPYNYSFFSNECPWNINGCTCMESKYSLSDQLVSDKYNNNLFNSYTFGRNKIKRNGLLNSVYNLAIAMSKNAIVRYITNKLVVEAPPAVLVAPAVVTSVVPTSVFASPAMVAPAMVALIMVAPEVAALKMTAMTVPVAPLGNDMTTAPAGNDLPATQIENNLTVSFIGKDSEVKPNTCVKRYFSLKKIWKKKTKTQRPKDQ